MWEPQTKFHSPPCIGVEAEISETDEKWTAWRDTTSYVFSVSLFFVIWVNWPFKATHWGWFKLNFTHTHDLHTPMVVHNTILSGLRRSEEKSLCVSMCVWGAELTQCHVHPCEGDWCKLVLPLCSWRQRRLCGPKAPLTPLKPWVFMPPPLTAAQERHRQQIIWAGLAPRKTSLIQKMATLLWTKGGTFNGQDSNTMWALAWDLTAALL